MPSDRVFCCIPVRIGAIVISAFLLVISLSSTVLMFVQRQGMRDWATLVQAVDIPLTDTAFDGIFYSMASILIAYTITNLYGLFVVMMQRRKLVQVYHVLNWFFVLLMMTISLSYWFYFKVKRDVYINDCQDLQNEGQMPFSATYTPVAVPGKNMLAGGSDKSHCINYIKKLVVVSGVIVFLGNFLQMFLASCIGTYAANLHWKYLHQRVKTQDIDELAMRKLNPERD